MYVPSVVLLLFFCEYVAFEFCELCSSFDRLDQSEEKLSRYFDLNRAGMTSKQPTMIVASSSKVTRMISGAKFQLTSELASCLRR